MLLSCLRIAWLKDSQFVQKGYRTQDFQIRKPVSETNAFRVVFHEIQEVVVPSNDIIRFGGNCEIDPGFIIGIARVREGLRNRVDKNPGVLQLAQEGRNNFVSQALEALSQLGTVKDIGHFGQSFMTHKDGDV